MAQTEESRNSTPQERATPQTEWMKSNLTLDENASTETHHAAQQGRPG